MSFIEDIKTKIGANSFSELDKLSNAAFSFKNGFHSNPPLGTISSIEELLPRLNKISEQFEDENIEISPIDLINILYKCKLVKAYKTYEKYNKKINGYNLVDEFNFFIPLEKGEESFEYLVEEYSERLKSQLTEKTLIIEINSFRGNNYEIQSFFDHIFKELNYPFSAFIDDTAILQFYKKHVALDEYKLERAKDYFCSPSIGFTVYGSQKYCRWKSTTWLKTFISLLKIGGFIYPGQIEFGGNIATLQAPTFPVFLGKASKGIFMWDEDKKEPQIKIPDGCLCRSFGNRSITNMWLDIRNFKLIREFILSNRAIFESLNNPWKQHVLSEIIPTLDILSSSVHSTEIGAKILLIYCCLEHLFVPSDVRTNNRNFIVDGINLLDTGLIDWFEKLYDYRCDYSHKGYIKADKMVIDFIKISMANTLKLLSLKLKNEEN